MRVQHLLRSMLGTRWDSETWPTAKAELRRALELRRELAHDRWWNLGSPTRQPLVNYGPVYGKPSDSAYSATVMISGPGLICSNA